MNSVETWLYLLLPRSLSCVVAEDENFQSSECGNLSLILTSMLEKQNLYLWYLESVGLCYCKWMHVVVTFKVHSKWLKTIKIQTSYSFIYTLRQEMKLQTWCSSGGGILPWSWGTGQSVPGCRGITCSERLRMGRKKEGSILWRKALCCTIQCELCMDWTRNGAGIAEDCRSGGDFSERCFIAPRLHRVEEADTTPGWQAWDNMVGSLHWGCQPARSCSSCDLQSVSQIQCQGTGRQLSQGYFPQSTAMWALLAHSQHFSAARNSNPECFSHFFLAGQGKNQTAMAGPGFPLCRMGFLGASLGFPKSHNIYFSQSWTHHVRHQLSIREARTNWGLFLLFRFFGHSSSSSWCLGFAEGYTPVACLSMWFLCH